MLNRKTERNRYMKKVKKIKIKSIGLRKRTTTILWMLLIGSLSFGLYKNFTAIDRHTVHEEKIIETQIVDTNFISSFVEKFAETFYSWEPKKEILEKRTSELKNYLSDDLLQLNQEMIRSDIPTASIVKEMKIWKVDQLNQNNYSVVYSIIQEIEESKGKTKEKRQVESAFSVKVKTRGNDQLVIVSNPVMASLPKKLNMQYDPMQDDMNIEQETKKEIHAFLMTFFKVYPTARQTELQYYLACKDIKEIKKDYVFSEIKQINYFKVNNGVKVKVVAVYLDQDTKAVLSFTYDLVLKKTDEKWIIDRGI